MKTKGQSLIEMVVVIGITGIALVAIAMVTTTAIRNARVSKERSVARNIMNQTMESIRNTRDKDPDTFFSMTSHNQTLSSTGENPTYDRSVDYNVAIAGSKIQVTVNISWTDAGNTFNVTDSTYLQKW